MWCLEGSGDMFASMNYYALDDFVFIFKSFFLFLILCLFIFARLFFIVLLCQIWLSLITSFSTFPMSRWIGLSNSTLWYSIDNRAKGRIAANVNKDDKEERCMQSCNHWEEGKLLFWCVSCEMACIFLEVPTPCQIIGFRPLGLLHNIFPTFIWNIVWFVQEKCCLLWWQKEGKDGLLLWDAAGTLGS